MKFTGTVSRTHFGDFYALMVEFDAQWAIASTPEDPIHFEVLVHDQLADEFKEEVCRLLPCVEFNKPPTLFKRFVNFLTKKGDTCDQCC